MACNRPRAPLARQGYVTEGLVLRQTPRDKALNCHHTLRLRALFFCGDNYIHQRHVAKTNKSRLAPKIWAQLAAVSNRAPPPVQAAKSQVPRGKSQKSKCSEGNFKIQLETQPLRDNLCDNPRHTRDKAANSGPHPAPTTYLFTYASCGCMHRANNFQV